jgi:excisionase family DNA binding protein
VSTNSEQRWLKVAEVAQLLRVSKMTVYRLIASGELRSARVGRSYRLAEEDVDTYLQRGDG